MNPTVLADVAAEILSLERAALERWARGDPDGFLELSAADVVYVDPFLDAPLYGRAALASHYEPLRGRIEIPRFEIENARVQVAGEAAVLTFNFASHGGAEDPLRWNCTEVYRRAESAWQIIQTHWAFTRGVRPSRAAQAPFEP